MPCKAAETGFSLLCETGSDTGLD